MGSKKTFRKKKYGFTDLALKIDAIDDKRLGKVCCYAIEECSLDL